MSFLFAAAHAADAAEHTEQALFGEVDLSLFAIVLCAVFAVACVVLALRFVKA